MTVPRRSASIAPSAAILGAALVVLLAACGPTTTQPPVDVPSPSVIANPEPSLTPVPGGPGGPARSAVASHAPRTTNVEGFGEIADDVPASFPRLPDETETDGAVAAATSGTFVSNLGPGTASQLIARALEARGWTVDVSSPLEDGTVVLDATGPSAGCRTEVRFTPASGSIFMSVLYGASCPDS